MPLVIFVPSKAFSSAFGFNTGDYTIYNAQKIGIYLGSGFLATPPLIFGYP